MPSASLIIVSFHYCPALLIYNCIIDTMIILAKDCSSVEAQVKFTELSYKYFELDPFLFMDGLKWGMRLDGELAAFQ